MFKDKNISYIAFILLLAIVSIAFVTIALPYFSAILWAVILAMLAHPLYSWINRKINRPSMAALSTLSIVVVVAVIPLLMLTISLISQTISFYRSVQSGSFNIAQYATDVFHSLPQHLQVLINKYTHGAVDSLQLKLSQMLVKISQFLASKALALGGDTLSVVISFGIMLYLLFFFLRDGEQIMTRVLQLFPLKDEQKNSLFEQLGTVMKATVKGNFVIAAVQGCLGGIMFLFLGLQSPLLWGVVMAFLSLLPAIGNAIIWLPTAIYLLVVGDYTSGLILLAWGVLVMGLVDNFLRPLLVGKTTKLPDYMVLMSTLGGLSVFGPDGLVLGPAIASLFIVAWGLLPTHTKELEKNV